MNAMKQVIFDDLEPFASDLKIRAAGKVFKGTFIGFCRYKSNLDGQWKYFIMLKDWYDSDEDADMWIETKDIEKIAYWNGP